MLPNILQYAGQPHNQGDPAQNVNSNVTGNSGPGRGNLVEEGGQILKMFRRSWWLPRCWGWRRPRNQLPGFWELFSRATGWEVPFTASKLKGPAARGQGSLLSPLMSLPCLEQCLGHRMHPISICRMSYSALLCTSYTPGIVLSTGDTPVTKEIFLKSSSICRPYNLLEEGPSLWPIHGYRGEKAIQV